VQGEYNDTNLGVEIHITIFMFQKSPYFETKILNRIITSLGIVFASINVLYSYLLWYVYGTIRELAHKIHFKGKQNKGLFSVTKNYSFLRHKPGGQNGQKEI
jgi:hypothetical protein